MSLESAAAAINPVAAVPKLVGKMIYDQRADADRAREAQKKLEAQRKAQLAQEAADRAAAKKRAEETGQRVGLGGAGRALLVGQPTGAGSGDTAFGPGAASLFGN